MSDNKFFIGLGTTIPSTRVLKPPGGDCNDLFGLNTRQQAQIKCLKGTSNVIDYLLSQQLPNESHLRKSVSRNTSLSSVTSMDKPQLMPSSSDSTSNARPLNTFHGSSESSRDSIAFKESRKGYSIKEPFHFDMDSVGDSFHDLSIRDHSSPDSVSIQESRNTSRQNSELSCSEGKSYNDTQRTNDSKMNLNSNSTPKTRPSTDIKYISGDFEMNLNKVLDKTFIRNPITGVLTEVKSRNKSNPVISRVSSMPVIKSKACKSEMSACSTIILEDSLKATSKVLSRRNPITGEGIPVNPLFANVSHNRIRVIHPPGGMSSGIY